jgi:hypothetical protein
MKGVTHMSYAQWMTLSVLPTGCDVTLKNFQHSWGKFYINDKDDEKSPGSLNGSLAQDGGDFTFGACGREDASSGTTGSVDLFDGHIIIGTYNWDCPWGSKTNTSNWSPSSIVHPQVTYNVSFTGANIHGGALGSVTCRISKA